MNAFFCTLGVVLVGCVLSNPTGKVSYAGYKVLRIKPALLEDFNKVVDIGKKYDLDFWKFPKYLNESFDINVAPSLLPEVIKELGQTKADVQIWIDDLQKVLDQGQARPRSRESRATGTFDLFHYHYYTSIEPWIDSLSRSHINVGNLARTHEGRNIKLVKFSRGPNADGSPKKIIMFDGGIHAREWISTASVLYFIDQLAHNTADPTVSTLLDKFDWYIVPVVNPDGYEYSTHTDRMWRKNRVPHYPGQNNFCSSSHNMGVDLNRNFAFHWDPSNGGSSNQCEETYAGPSALSEIETQTISNLMKQIASNTVLYMNFHSYGEYWIYPWGYTRTMPSDWHDLDHLAKVARSAIYHRHHTLYTVGEDTRVLYAAAGGADDEAKGSYNIKYAYTVELRDTGRYGFALPSSYIRPTAEETWDGIKAVANELIRLYSL